MRCPPAASVSTALWPGHHSQSQHHGISCALNQKRGVHMKKLFLGSMALVALGVGAPAAFAADMRVAAYAPPPAPVYTWTGCYVGAYAGTSTGISEQISQQGATAGTSITGPFHLSGF